MLEYLEIGKIINTHGVAGGLKIDPWCDSPSVLAGIGRLYRKKGTGETVPGNEHFEALDIEKITPHGRFVIAYIESCDSFEKANILRDTVLYAAREDIPIEEGRHFIADLIGLPVINIDSGKIYGKLREVNTSGKQDIYEIDTANGIVLLPAVDEFVKSIDLEKGIYIRPIEGFFDEI